MTWYRCLIFCIVLSYLHVKVSSRAETFQDVSLPIPGKEIVIELMGRGTSCLQLHANAAQGKHSGPKGFCLQVVTFFFRQG